MGCPRLNGCPHEQLDVLVSHVTQSEYLLEEAGQVTHIPRLPGPNSHSTVPESTADRERQHLIDVLINSNMH